jgi:hypothetical protein
MREGQKLRLLSQKLALIQRGIADWTVPQKQRAMERCRYNYVSEARPYVEGWKNIDEMIVDIRKCVSQLEETDSLLTSYKQNADSIPSGVWNNFGRG